MVLHIPQHRTPTVGCLGVYSDDKGCAGFLCSGVERGEPEFLNDYERQIECIRDSPKKLPRPLNWRVTLASRGGSWGSSPVPMRCDVCGMTLSSRETYEAHMRSPRHARNSRRHFDHRSQVPECLLSPARQQRKNKFRSRSLQPQPSPPITRILAGNRKTCSTIHRDEAPVIPVTFDNFDTKIEETSSEVVVEKQQPPRSPARRISWNDDDDENPGVLPTTTKIEPPLSRVV